MDSRTAVVEQQIDVVVRKAGFGMNLVKMEGKNFFGTIREKLMWGLDVRN
jgi:NAD+ kinase